MQIHMTEISSTQIQSPTIVLIWIAPVNEAMSILVCCQKRFHISAA